VLCIGKSGDSSRGDADGSIQAVFGVTEAQFGTMLERYIGRQ
jgi:hypothetical protein